MTTIINHAKGKTIGILVQNDRGISYSFIDSGYHFTLPEEGSSGTNKILYVISGTTPSENLGLTQVSRTYSSPEQVEENLSLLEKQVKEILERD